MAKPTRHTTVQMATMAPTAPTCLICRTPLSVRAAFGRKSGKPFVTLVCPADGRHFRAFIADTQYVQKVLNTGVHQ